MGGDKGTLGLGKIGSELQCFSAWNPRSCPDLTCHKALQHWFRLLRPCRMVMKTLEARVAEVNCFSTACRGALIACVCPLRALPSALKSSPSCHCQLPFGRPSSATTKAVSITLTSFLAKPPLSEMTGRQAPRRPGPDQHKSFLNGTLRVPYTD